MKSGNTKQLNHQLNENTFVLGVGCQKGGTSWLYDQLCSSKGFQAGFSKEYHVFDDVYDVLRKRLNSIDYNPHENNNNNNNNTNTQANDGSPSILADKNSIETFRLEPKTYFDYFQSLLDESETSHVTGDITPLYAGLPNKAYQQIREQFRQRGISVKVLFIMRDPIERIWSQIRMRRRNDEQTHNMLDQRTESDAMLIRYKQLGVEIRTRYEDTIKNIESCFNEHEILYLLYEELFTDTSRCQIENFLGIQLNTYDTHRIVNKTPKTDEVIDPDILKTVANHYKATYLFCDTKFNIRDKWQGLNYL